VAGKLVADVKVCNVLRDIQLRSAVCTQKTWHNEYVGWLKHKAALQEFYCSMR